MEAPDFFCTVVSKRSAYTVRYIDLEAKKVKKLEGTFNDPDSAKQAFKATFGEVETLYLDQQNFSRNVRSLAQYKRYDKLREEKAQQQNSQQ